MKLVTDNRFSTNRIVAVEERLIVPVSYVDPATGEVITRLITGKPDALLSELDDIAVVLDWKLTWALPPERQTADRPRPAVRTPVSYEGYFQQRFYAFLVMETYPQIQAVRLREFYPLAEPRPHGAW